MKTLILLFILILAVTGCAQNLAPRLLMWDYDFTPYPDSTIHIIIYQKSAADTSFGILDTTAANALQFDLWALDSLYSFIERDFFATAVQYNGPDIYAPIDSLFSYESAPSDTVGEYFRAKPPASISKGKFKVLMLEF